MLKHKDHFHGSDLEKIEAIYGIKKDQMRMISFNIHSHLIFFITLFFTY